MSGMRLAGRHTRGCTVIHWLLVLGLWLQVVGPVFAQPRPADSLQGLRIVACTPAGMVVMDLSADPEDTGGSDQPRVRQAGHCLLCATHPVPPLAAAVIVAVPAAPWAQPVAGFDEAPCDARITGAWEWPPARCPPHLYS